MMAKPLKELQPKCAGTRPGTRLSSGPLPRQRNSLAGFSCIFQLIPKQVGHGGHHGWGSHVYNRKMSFIQVKLDMNWLDPPLYLVGSGVE